MIERRPDERTRHASAFESRVDLGVEDRHDITAHRIVEPAGVTVDRDLEPVRADW